MGESWEGKNYTFFSHKACEFFPCHSTEKPEDFNCLFCYCPLYALGDKCGGNFKYTDGIKDCSSCMVPHRRENYGYIMSRYSDILELVRRDDGQDAAPGKAGKADQGKDEGSVGEKAGGQGPVEKKDEKRA